MHLAVVIDIDGTVDQAGLDRLRAHLNLTKTGRLTDDWDQTFGRRMIERTEQRSNTQRSTCFVMTMARGRCRRPLPTSVIPTTPN